ncbi:hypothetical protein B5X24_HaOG217285 [Helicoverpa armigera]|uniref:Uncharacterized protein n=1 Tax=Helicoverpa armigera TaxID=29058 RepID=A0A2W1AYQ4_HELAM|nr:hypothetical protein B5X24_HaOG217285 [Helicoverpa armigera]
MFRLLSVWSGAMPTVKPLFPTNLPQDFPFDPQEFAVFVLLGIVSGLLAALWVFLHRQYVLFIRNTKSLSNFLQKNIILIKKLPYLPDLLSSASRKFKNYIII